MYTGLSRYVGVDIADNSLRQFTERLMDNPTDRGKVTQLICADIGVESLTSSVLQCHTWTTANVNAGSGAAGSKGKDISVETLKTIVNYFLAIHNYSW